MLGPSVEHLLLVMGVDASDLDFALHTDIGDKLDLARVGPHLQSDQRLQNQQESNVESHSDLSEKRARRHDSEQEADQCVKRQHTDVGFLHFEAKLVFISVLDRYFESPE